MMRRLGIVVACLSTAGGMSPASGAEPPSTKCTLSMAADLEVRILPGGAVVVPAKVAGRDVWFFLGSSGAFPMVYESTANLLGLQQKPIMKGTELGSRTRRVESGLSGSSGALEQQTALQSFLLGRVSLGSWQAVVLPGADRQLMQLDGHPVIGILGTQLYRLVDAELDLANRRIRLFKATECKDPPVYWGGEYTVTPMLFDQVGAMHFTMELDGRKINTGLLNGMSTPSIDEGIAKRYFGFDRQSPGVIQEESDGNERSSFYAMSLTAAGLNVSNTRVHIGDSRVKKCGYTTSGNAGEAIQYSNCSNTVPFALGSSLLQKLRIYISAKQEKIYITRSTPAGAGPSLNPGLRVARRAGFTAPAANGCTRPGMPRRWRHR
jgi:hypothetical protein